jgi:predicted phosphodiesterase
MKFKILNKIKKILILSDTHGDEKKYKKIIKKQNADIVIHAGDY